MFNKHVTKELSAYCHGELSAEESRRVAEHLQGCRSCREEFEEIKFGIDLAGHLTSASAPESLWSEIDASLDAQCSDVAAQPKRPAFAFPVEWRTLAAVSVLLLLVLASGAAWYYTHSPNIAQDASQRAGKTPVEEPGKASPTDHASASWSVERLAGAPRIGSHRIDETGRLPVGEWLETDKVSRAKINVGKIGQVELEPNTRVRLVEARLTEHRLALARGTMHAKIWAPPRLFFVNTPSAVAVDLGCAYTLEVDDAGAGLLSVATGWVAFELDGRESFVPAGARCETRPGTGPGTPYFADASEAFQNALAKLDFDKSTSEARRATFDIVLAQARARDALTLWHLLARVDAAERGRVYDRMAALVPPPQGVTRAGVLKGDKHMLDLWWNQLGLGGASWWRMWKGSWPEQSR